MTFAVHANERGYTWPSVDHIAFTWRLDATTVRRQIKALLAFRKIFRTKKRCGWTGQVKVYRMPKFTRESRAQCTPFENEGSRDKGGRKAGERRALCPPNNDNDEQLSNQDHAHARGTISAQPVATSKPESGKKFGDGYQNQNQPAQDHIKWPEFAAWCHSKRDKHGNPCKPTETGFWTWLSRQKPEWRNKVRQNPDGEKGYVLNNKFLTDFEANILG